MAWTSEVDKAYAAGLFDGEGTVSLRSKANRHGVKYVYANTSIPSTDWEPIIWLAERLNLREQMLVLNQRGR